MIRLGRHTTEKIVDVLEIQVDHELGADHDRPLEASSTRGSKNAFSTTRSRSRADSLTGSCVPGLMYSESFVMMVVQSNAGRQAWREARASARCTPAPARHS
jgi:hypothetical protein